MLDSNFWRSLLFSLNYDCFSLSFPVSSLKNSISIKYWSSMLIKYYMIIVISTPLSLKKTHIILGWHIVMIFIPIRNYWALTKDVLFASHNQLLHYFFFISLWNIWHVTAISSAFCGFVWLNHIYSLSCLLHT